MSGLALLERLREHDPAMPAIIISGHLAGHPEVAHARSSGVAYLAKPVNVDELLGTLARLRSSH